MPVRSRHWPIIGLIAVGILIFVGPLAAGRIGLWNDNLIQNFPLRVLVGRIMDTGHYPLWNAFDWSGTPLLAGFNAGALYPLTLLFAVVPPALAWCLGEGFTFVLGALGLYCFLKGEGVQPWSAALGSTVWTMSGAFSGQWVHIATVQAASWVPWALVSVQRMAAAAGVFDLARASAIGALAGGMILLSGSPEMAVYGLIPVLCYAGAAMLHAAQRARILAMALLAVAVAALIGAVQWLPGVAFIAHSQRAQSTFAFFDSFAMPPSLTTLFVVPYLLGGYGYGIATTSYFGPSNLPEVSGYLGLLPLMAFFATVPAWWSKHSMDNSRVWHIVALVGLVLAWGGNTPLGALMYHVPGYGLLRDQSRNLMEVDLALAVLTALWLDRLPFAVFNPRWAGIPLAAAGCLVVVYVVNARGMVSWVAGQPVSVALARTAVPAVWTTAALVGAAGLLLLFTARRRWPIFAWVGLLVVDLGIYAGGQYWMHPAPTTVMRGTQKPWSSLNRWSRGKTRTAIYDPSLANPTILDAVGQPDLNVLSGVDSVQGYGSMVSERYFAATGAHPRLAYDPHALSGITPNRLNLGWLMARPDDFAYPMKPGQRALPSSSVELGPHRSTWLYFGQRLAVQHLQVVVSTPVTTRVRLATVNAKGQSLASQTMTISPNQGPAAVALTNRKTAIGIQAINVGGATLRIRRVTILTAQGRRYRLNGQLAPYVRYPQWHYIKNIGPMVLFHNTQTRGWAWLEKGNKPLGAVKVSALLQGGFSATVHAAMPVRLVVSQAYASGWYAYVYRPSKPCLAVPATRLGVIQSYRVPAGSSYVCLRYRPPLFMWGIVTTAGGFALLASLTIMARRQVKYTFSDLLEPTR